MKFNDLYSKILEKLDPDVEAVWKDVIPNL